MQQPTDLIDLGPLLQIVLLAAALATLPLVWLAWRHRGESAPQRLRALTLVTLFITFDLVLFGAFTRLTDSGLGCPDWPGCYGNSSPFGAVHQITQAETHLPDGPVTQSKAWIEMVHRYLATGVGALLTVLMVWSLLAVRRLKRSDPAQARLISPGWAALTFVWVCLQGAFGALTVTMKLYPAIVTLHLLGGIGLLALLAVQIQRHAPQAPVLSSGLRQGVWVVFGLVLVQVALGGWVSTNYAVLACQDVPTCQGQWWPPMDFDAGFTLQRGLGVQADGSALPFAALTAIHVVHRLGALTVLTALALLIAALRHPAPRYAKGLLAVAVLQTLTGLSNVVLDWPLLAAVAHTGGAAVLVTLLAALLAHSRSTAYAPSHSHFPSVAPSR
ncbi:MAG: COX15/CtaA family protein [Sphaerotilus sp.]|nr:COX15/CtaA family protein [Sphaerotilus sp.]